MIKRRPKFIPFVSGIQGEQAIPMAIIAVDDFKTFLKQFQNVLVPHELHIVV